MKIKNQFLVSIIIFTVMFAGVAVSVFFTQQQAIQVASKEAISRDIQKRASNIAYISNDYFLYQESTDLNLWQTEFSALSSDLSKLNFSDPEQQTLLSNIKDDVQRLSNRWNDVVTYLENAPRNVSIRVLPEFQTRWSRNALQNQVVIFESEHLSQTLRGQIDQLNAAGVILILALLAIFGAYFLTNYLLTYRNTLQSIAELQAGIAVVGSGNLEYSLKTDKKDEIGDISRSFTQMASNLKKVTASKTDLEQAQTSLRESEQRWATTLASIGDAVIATDLSGRIVFMNVVAEALTGWKLSEASLKPIKEIFNIVNEQTRLEVEDPVSKVLEKGMIIGLANHTVLIRKNKTEVPIDDSGAPIRDEEGKTTGVVLIFRDITERKKAEEALRESEERLRFHAENTPLAVVEWDNKFVVTRWAGDAEKMFGWTGDETIGKPIMDLRMIYEPDRLMVEKTMNRLTIGEPKVVSSNRNITKDGRVIYCTWYNSVLLDAEGKMTSVFSFVEDNTAKVKAEKELEENNKSLEKLVEERTMQLKDSERLAAIGATAGMVGHDIRNPLQAITSDVYLAKADLASMQDSEERKNVQESLGEIEKNIFYINKIVADLQDFARPLSPKLEEIDLEQVVHSALAHVKIPGNVTVKHSVRGDFPKIKSDPEYLQRILTNLANNAIQAMPKGGKLTITATAKNGNATVTVEDNGEGIPETVRSKIFTPLVTTKSKGQGFGLSVVKRFTEALGGTVRFESEVGKGTKFTIELPV